MSRIFNHYNYLCLDKLRVLLVVMQARVAEQGVRGCSPPKILDSGNIVHRSSLALSPSSTHKPNILSLSGGICWLYVPTVFVRIEAQAAISFPGVSTQPLFEPGFYSGPASIKIFFLNIFF